jgi:hypothetical protein
VAYRKMASVLRNTTKAARFLKQGRVPGRAPQDPRHPTPRTMHSADSKRWTLSPADWRDAEGGRMPYRRAVDHRNTASLVRSGDMATRPSGLQNLRCSQLKCLRQYPDDSVLPFIDMQTLTDQRWVAAEPPRPKEKTPQPLRARLRSDIPRREAPGRVAAEPSPPGRNALVTAAPLTFSMVSPMRISKGSTWKLFANGG